MAMILGGVALVVAGLVWAVTRCPLVRAISLSFDCFAEASRGEPGALH